MRALALVATALLAAVGCTKRAAPGAGGEIKVAGASDLVYAMEEIAPRFEKATGTRVVFIPGSSGKLAAQIQQGAPFDVFLSANVKFVEDAIAAGACLADTKHLYGYGRVVMWSREGGPALPADLTGLADPRYATIAIAQPDHAPYGAAARAALATVGVWDAVAGRLVYGSNIKDTMQMAETGNAEVALIALALARKSNGQHVEVPAELHPPLEQGMAACKGQDGGGEQAARAFVDFMRSDEIRALLTEYGFGLPER
jgi:molybdate transport system substrate-binding protein